MPKRNSLYSVILFFIAVFLMAGCASKETVKKDESLVPTTKQLTETTKTLASSSKQESTTINTTSSATALTPTVASIQLEQKASPLAQLQSALEKIYFDYDSAALSEASRTTLTKNALLIKKKPGLNIRIEGNCDERGSAEYNLALGERRAISAQQYLVTLGVKPEQLSIISYGKEKPAVHDTDEAAMAKNRRDEFVVLVK